MKSTTAISVLVASVLAFTSMSSLAQQGQRGQQADRGQQAGLRHLPKRPTLIE